MFRVFRSDYRDSCKSLYYPEAFPQANIPVCVTGFFGSPEPSNYWISHRDSTYLIYAEGFQANEGAFSFKVNEASVECDEKYNQVNLNFAGIVSSH
jgi:hypothetical protein